MKQELDISKWARADHFRFFGQFEEPFFGITVQVNCTRAHQVAKENDYSFFLYYLHCSILAANEVPNFRYRINDGKVFEYDVVHPSATINRPDETFGFSYMDHHPDFNVFAAGAKKVIEEVQASKGLTPALSGENVIHCSSLPWLNFTSISIARSFTFPDSAPKFSFGKMTSNGNELVMPVSVIVHHGLMDGLHVSRFFDRFQALLDR